MTIRDYIGINTYWFGIAFLWNALHPIILPAILLDSIPGELKNTYLGALTFVGLLLAMLIQPISGALSDRTHSRWGKRRPWIAVGTLFSLLFLGLMAHNPAFLWLAGCYLLLQVASNTAHGPAQGLIPDLVPVDKHGLASGVKNLFDMSGLIITSLVAGRLVDTGYTNAAIALIAGVLGLSALITLILTRENNHTDISSNTPNDQPILSAANSLVPDYTRLLVSRFLILLGIYAVQGFAQYYIRDWLGYTNAAAITGNLMAAIGLAITVFVLPAGFLSDRFGRWRLNLFAALLASFGILSLLFVHQLSTLYLCGAVIGSATGIFLSANWAMATSFIPPDQAGKYLGLSNLATAGAGATSRLVGPLIDLVNALKPGYYLGYPLLFIIAALSVVIGAATLFRIKKRI